MPTDPHPADVELVARWFSRWFGASSIRSRDRECAREVLSALAAAGRLLPADATVEYGIEVHPAAPGYAQRVDRLDEGALPLVLERGWSYLHRWVGPWLPHVGPWEPVSTPGESNHAD